MRKIVLVIIALLIPVIGRGSVKKDLVIEMNHEFAQRAYEYKLSELKWAEREILKHLKPFGSYYIINYNTPSEYCEAAFILVQAGQIKEDNSVYTLAR